MQLAKFFSIFKLLHRLLIRVVNVCPDGFINGNITCSSAWFYRGGASDIMGHKKGWITSLPEHFWSFFGIYQRH